MSLSGVLGCAQVFSQIGLDLLVRLFDICTITTL